MHIDTLFEHLKQSKNEVSVICQSKNYIAPPGFNKKGDGWLVQIYWKSRLTRPCVSLSWLGHLETFRLGAHTYKRKNARNAISQLLYLQIVMVIIDYEYAR